MKTLVLLALASATLIYGRDGSSYLPTQSELDTALSQAAVAWGPTPAYVKSIVTGDLGDCVLNGAWADLAARTITLNLNPTCHWTRELVRIAVMHEYGHLVLNTSAHSLDRRSVMFKALAYGQRVLPEDLEWLDSRKRAERPTLMTPEDGDLVAEGGK